MAVHFATLLEAMAERAGERVALIHAGQRLTYRALDERAARLARALADAGLEIDAKVAILSLNRPEWIEAMFAAFKIGGVPINVNYRYGPVELKYLLDNCDAEAVVFEARYGATLRGVLGALPKIKLLVEIEDESDGRLSQAMNYEKAIASNAPLAPVAHGPDEIYMYYTGGTTGMPKGVMWRHVDFAQRQLATHATRFAHLGLKLPATLDECLANIEVIRAHGEAPTRVVASPFMHGAGLWVGALLPFTQGGASVTLSGANFDPDELWRTVVATGAESIAIVGDAFARPMLQALDAAEAAGRPYDLAKVKRILSTGVMWSAEVKAGLLAKRDMELFDGMGSTEGGGYGASTATRANPVPTARFATTPTTKVLAEDGTEVAPGSGAIGALASANAVPLGYYKDPAKSAATFRTVNGVRYTFTGDFARVEADGTITLLGRGSQCINTGGEKVFPEEVEEALKRHPAVIDCLVVGVPDKRFGEKIAAVLSLRPAAHASDDELAGSVREQLSGYKMPRLIVRVAEVRRAPNGKADYAWARETARAADMR